MTAASATFGARGSIDQISVPSASLRRSFPAWVVVPHRYAESQKRYGSVYLLHGAGAPAESWLYISNLAALADEYGRIFVVATAGSHSWYVDHGRHNLSETFITKKLVPHIDRTYRTAGGNDRWITGFSMGGYGGLSLGLTHGDLFCAAGGICPALAVSRWDDYWLLTEAMGAPSERTRRDLFTSEKLKELKQRKKLVISLTCGTEDFFYAENLAAHRALAAAEIQHQWIAHPGGHCEMMDEMLARQLAYFREQTKKDPPPPRTPNGEGATRRNDWPFPPNEATRRTR